MIQGVGRCSTPPSLQKGSLEMAMEDCRPTDADENACPNAPILDPLGPARQILKLLRWPIEAQHVHLGPGIAAVVMLRYHHISRGTACPNSCALGTARNLGQIDFERLYLKKSLGCQQSWQTKIARAEDQGNHHSVLGRQQP